MILPNFAGQRACEVYYSLTGGTDPCFRGVDGVFGKTGLKLAGAVNAISNLLWSL